MIHSMVQDMCRANGREPSINCVIKGCMMFYMLFLLLFACLFVVVGGGGQL